MDLQQTIYGFLECQIEFGAARAGGVPALSRAGKPMVFAFPRHSPRLLSAAEAGGACHADPKGRGSGEGALASPADPSAQWRGMPVPTPSGDSHAAKAPLYLPQITSLAKYNGQSIPAERVCCKMDL